MSLIPCIVNCVPNFKLKSDEPCTAVEDGAGSSSKGEDSLLPSNIDQPHYCWTMDHAFYAGMGGFVIDMNNKADPFI
jgi:hypothetical protein